VPGAPGRGEREGGTIACRRLRTQRIAGPGFATPADVVAWFGAVQAQDFAGALWAIGLRTKNATERLVAQAIADRTIVRSWPLRGTLHFVAAADVRWLLASLAPRVIARAAPRFKQLELDAAVFTRSRKVLVKALEGGRRLTRPAIYQRLEAASIATSHSRGLHILFRLAHDGLICFGAHEGRQPTFALLDEWVPPARSLDRDEALAELARRYFASHGPATVRDFAWWSGLGAADARAALDLARPYLERTSIIGETDRAGGKAPQSVPAPRTPHVALLPPFDEYTVAYRDRSAVLPAKHAAPARNGIFGPIVVIDGQVAGTWTRRLTGDAVAIALKPFVRLPAGTAPGVAAAAARYGRFLGRPARLS
jgi:hypothetical protein